MDRYEVTNGRFSEFVAANPTWGPAPRSDTLTGYLRHWSGGTYPEGMEAHPVAFVTWQAAQRFCRWAGGRLPTEAEWEFAARGRGGNEFPWGDERPSPDRANYGASGLQRTTTVGHYPPNSIGLHDMAGNVWEWLLDEWQPSYSSDPRVDPVAGGIVPDDQIPNIRGRRVVRGASFGGSVVNLRTRWRDSHEVANAVAFVGFRCAYPVQ
jgi:formylglycine-generating enzyme required for sulfatase activity